MFFKRKVLESIFLIVILLQETLCARILAVFPVPSISHQVVFRPITQELARRGHEVTVITPDPAFPKGGAPKNLKEIDVHDISYQTFGKLFHETHNVKEGILSFSGMKQFSMFLTITFIEQLKTAEVKELINDKNKKYDLILLEIIRPALIFSHFFKAPVIFVSSMGSMTYNDHVIGAPTHPLLYPVITRKRLYHLSLTEKLTEIFKYYSIQCAFVLNEAQENKLLRQTFGRELPTLSELQKNVDMLFINLHPIWSDNRPVPPGVVYMGGIHQIPKKELPKDLRTYLDSSKRGVIYLSFGTNVLAGMIPQEKIEIFVKVLSQLPYDVLWKWDKDELPGKGDNIKLSKWLPQSDLLRHPNIKLFITQAGLQSTDEAISAGVPLVAVPMLGDQWYNAEKYVKHGIGKQLDIETVTEEEFKAAVETVIKDSSYRINIEKLRELFRDQPESPLQRVVWWTEHVIRHGGGKHLRSPAANISYAEYFEIEVVAVIILIILFLSALLTTVVYLTFKFLANIFHKKKKVKSN